MKERIEYHGYRLIEGRLLQVVSYYETRRYPAKFYPPYKEIGEELCALILFDNGTTQYMPVK